MKDIFYLLIGCGLAIAVPAMFFDELFPNTDEKTITTYAVVVLIFFIVRLGYIIKSWIKK